MRLHPQLHPSHPTGLPESLKTVYMCVFKYIQSKGVCVYMFTDTPSVGKWLERIFSGESDKSRRKYLQTLASLKSRYNKGHSQQVPYMLTELFFFLIFYSLWKDRSRIGRLSRKVLSRQKQQCRENEDFCWEKKTL